MNEVQRELDAVYKLLAAVSVTGDDVERMAAAKAGLRKAYQLLEHARPAAEAVEDHGGAPCEGGKGGA